MPENDLQFFLNKKAEQYDNLSFITEDPVSIPHQFSGRQDIEISGFFAALFAWGRRSLILQKANHLLDLMDQAPYEFKLQHEEQDLKRFLGFVHRTFNATDILFFISFLRKYYRKYASLEDAFSMHLQKKDPSVENALNGFYHTLFEGDFPERSKKHVAAPFKKSACKRLNMFLRWMVRKDSRGVDFGIWEKISPHQLVIPMDIHVRRVAARLGLIPVGKSVNWTTALALTDALKEFDAKDPVKYDFALFGLGIIEKFC